jgi:DNA primase catalytic subunit
METENKVLLDLKIIRKKQELKKIKLIPRYYLLVEYKNIINDLKSLLRKQKDIDKINFISNLMSIDEFKKEVIKRRKNKKIFMKLSQIEKEFILNKQYDFMNDELNLLTKNTSPDCKLVEEWRNLQVDIFNKIND